MGYAETDGADCYLANVANLGPTEEGWSPGVYIRKPPFDAMMFFLDKCLLTLFFSFFFFPFCFRMQAETLQIRHGFACAELCWWIP